MGGGGKRSLSQEHQGAFGVKKVSKQVGVSGIVDAEIGEEESTSCLHGGAGEIKRGRGRGRVAIAPVDCWVDRLCVVS